MGIGDFFKTIFLTLNPLSYRSLSARKYSDCFSYFFTVLFLAFCAMIILAIPMLASAKSDLRENMGKIQKLNVHVDLETSEPVLIPEKNTKIIIDTTGQYTNLSKGKVLITDKDLVKKRGMCLLNDNFCFLYKNKVTTTNLSENEDLLKDKEKVVNSLTFWFLVLSPFLLLTAYLFFAIKYMLIIIVFSLLAYIITSIASFDIKARHIFKNAIYASTLMIILDIIAIPIGIKTYFIPLTIFVLFFVMSIIFVGESESARRKQID